MPRETQNKILRVLVDQTFQRVGGSTKVTVDVRIVSSTSRNIEADIAAGKFREDLYHRLSVVPIRVPPLAERREDIPELVEYFMTQISQITGLPKRKVGVDALAVLQSHDWPGNVRQLRNNVERLMILAGGDPDAVITAAMLPQDVGSMIPAHAERQRRRASDEPRLARGARSVRARISAWRRSTASAAIFRAPPSSSAWSARRCTASSRRWAIDSTLTDDIGLHEPHRLRQRPLPAACATPRSTSRIAAISSATASMKSARCGEGASSTSGATSTRLAALARRAAHPHADVAEARSASCCAR